MADFNKPATGEQYSTHFSSIRDARESVAVGFDGTSDTNIPANAIGWDSTNSRWKRYVSGAWQALCSLYEITVRRAIEADSCTGNAATSSSCSGNANTANLATAANNLKVDGTPRAGDWFLPADHLSVTNSRKCNNTFDDPATARNASNLDVYTRQEVDGDFTQVNNSLALKAPIANPTFTGVPAAPTPAAGTNTTQLATTAFVLAQIASVLNGVMTLGDYVDLSSYLTAPYRPGLFLCRLVYIGGVQVGCYWRIHVGANGDNETVRYIASGIPSIYRPFNGGGATFNGGHDDNIVREVRCVGGSLEFTYEEGPIDGPANCEYDGFFI